MPAYSLYPAYIKINYTSVYGSHVMTLPSVPIEADILQPSGFAFVLRGMEAPVDVAEAVADFVTLLLPYFSSDVTFQDAQAFTLASEGAAPELAFSFSLNLTGTSAIPGWHKATQETFTYRATGGTLFKLVLLDVRTDNSFDKTSVVPGSGTMFDLNAYIIADATWLASRGGGRPATFLQTARTLNEKLRRRYGMN